MDIRTVGVLPIEKMAGDDDNDTALLREMSVEAKRYLEAFDWCVAAEPAYWGGGIGGVLSIFLFRVHPTSPTIDQLLWVIVGDIPPLYLTLDGSGSPSEAFDTYLDLMEQWVSLARQGRTSDDLPTTGVEPTPEWAAKLDQRLQFIKANVRASLTDSAASGSDNAR